MRPAMRRSALIVAAMRWKTQSLRLAGVRDHLGSTLAMLREVRRHADDFDIIHFHVDLLPQALFHELAHKCLITLHGRLDSPDTLPLYKAYPEMPLVSISNAQRRPMPADANWLATIPHGLASHVCPFDPEGGSYLAFLGRISPEKRPDRAIEIAKRAGIPLKLAAKVDAVDLEYFETEIEPLIAPFRGDADGVRHRARYIEGGEVPGFGRSVRGRGCPLSVQLQAFEINSIPNNLLKNGKAGT